LYLNPVLLFVVIALYRLEPRDLKVIVQATIWGAVLAAGYGAYTFSHSMNDVQQARLYLSFSNDFVYDESIDPNDFAASLMLPFALTLMMFLRARLGAAKICWLAALAVVCAGFVVTGSRGAAFGAAIMIAYLIWRSRHRVQLLILAAISVIPLMATPLIHRFSDATLATGSGRIGIWKVGIASLHRYWLFGAGFGNFNNAYRQYFLSVPHPDELLWNRIAHSIFIGSAVELGLVGLVLMIAFWFLQFRELARVKSSGFIGDISVALSSAVLGLFVTGSTLSLMGSKYTWLTFSLIALTRSIVMQSPRSYERT
jgi:O-antigen ligase